MSTAVTEVGMEENFSVVINLRNNQHQPFNKTMGLSALLCFRQRHQTAPDSPSSYSAAEWKPKKTTPSPSLTQKIDASLGISINNVVLSLEERGISLPQKRSRHYDAEAILTQCANIIKDSFPNSLELIRRLSQAWTLLWCHYNRQLQPPQDKLDLPVVDKNPSNTRRQDLEKAIQRCNAIRKELCTLQVNLTGIKKKGSRPRFYRNFPTKHEHEVDDDLLRNIHGLDLEQSTVAMATPRQCHVIPKTQYYAVCGHFCATSTYCDTGVCPICSYNAQVHSTAVRPP